MLRDGDDAGGKMKIYRQHSSVHDVKIEAGFIVDFLVFFQSLASQSRMYHKLEHEPPAGIEGAFIRTVVSTHVFVFAGSRSPVWYVHTFPFTAVLPTATVGGKVPQKQARPNNRQT